GTFGPKKTPYVWVFDRDGTDGRRKAPINLFTETHNYRLVGPAESRDQRLEHRLSELEDRFTRIRNTTFFKGVLPNEDQIAWVLVFLSTAHTWTKSFRDFHRSQWGSIRERMESLEMEFSRATPEKRHAMELISPAL